MSVKGIRFREDEDETPSRDFDPEEFKSGPTSSGFAVGEPGESEKLDLVPGEQIEKEVVRKLKRRNRTKAIRERAKEKYAGQGLVAIEKSTEDLIAVADSMHEMLAKVRDSENDPDDTLFVRCYQHARIPVTVAHGNSEKQTRLFSK